jgi:carboxylesterase type B
MYSLRLSPIFIFLGSCLAASPSITISNGTLNGGSCSGSSAIFYKGIPYAQPPIGNLRFAPPQPYDQSYDGVRDATQPPPACIQFSSVLAEAGLVSEDW